MINLTKIADCDRNCLIGQKQFIHTSLSRARIRKLPVHVHMTHVVKIDNITGHEEKVICILFYRLFFIACLSKNHAVSQNLYS